MKRLMLAAATIAMLGLAACETPTPYQPLNQNAAHAGGYSELKIEQDRWRVIFSGNSMTSRQTVETYLLYRAAELTVAQGYDWFETVQRHTDKDSQTYGWAPSWRYYGGGFGWRSWDPGWGGAFWGDDIDLTTITQYEASAEIVVHHGPKPAGDARAYDARDVLANLASKIVKPS